MRRQTSAELVRWLRVLDGGAFGGSNITCTMVAPGRRLHLFDDALLVEDLGDLARLPPLSDRSRELLAAILEARGASVESVDSGEAALELIPRVRPDVIVSDIGMPGMDGLTLIREVRRIPASRGGSTPAIALTAYVHPDDRKRALAAGFDRHLGKPVKADLVASTIVSLVEAPGRRAD